MKRSPISTVAVLLAVLTCNIGHSAEKVARTNAVQVLQMLREVKVPTLVSRSKIFVTDPRRNPETIQHGETPFAQISIRTPRMINAFGFEAELTRPALPPCIMKVASRKDGALVVVESPVGQPYCLMADSLLVLCDPENPGGLAYYENGSTLWGFYQIPEESTGMDFRMTFVPTNVLSTAFLDVENILRQTLIEATNTTSKTSFAANSRTLRVETENSITELTLDFDRTSDPFSIAGIAMGSHQGAGLNFSNFIIGTTRLEGLFDLTKQDVEKLGLPMRQLTKDELSTIQMLPTTEPMPPEKQKVSAQLKALIESRCKSTTTQMAPISDEATAIPESD